MMYMDDAVRGTLELMAAPADRIKIRTSYNLGAMSFTPMKSPTASSNTCPIFR